MKYFNGHCPLCSVFLFGRHLHHDADCLVLVDETSL